MSAKHIKALGRGCVIAGVLFLLTVLFIIRGTGSFLSAPGSKLILGTAAVLFSAGFALIGWAKKKEGGRPLWCFILSASFVLSFVFAVCL